MQGCIAWLRLDTREGIINTEAGGDVSFRLQSDGPDLQGGDIVDFDLVANGDGVVEARNIRLVAKWIDRLNKQHSPLVRELFATVAFAET
jgi:hypothetical protein